MSGNASHGRDQDRERDRLSSSLDELAESHRQLQVWLAAESGRVRRREGGFAILVLLAVMGGGVGGFWLANRASSEPLQQVSALQQLRADLEGRLLALEGPDSPASEVAQTAEPREESGRFLSGKPDFEAPPSGSAPRDPGYLRALDRPDLSEDMAEENAVSSAEGESVAPLKQTDPGEDPVRLESAEPDDSSAEEANADDDSPLAAINERIPAAFQQLLDDAGLRRFRLMSARCDPVDVGLFDVVMAETNIAGTGTGSVQAQRVTLDYDQDDSRASLVLEGTDGLREGSRVHYEDGKVRIQIPGFLPREWIADPLPWVFGLDGERVGAEAEHAFESTQGKDLLVLFQRLLDTTAGQSIQLKSVERVEDGRLLNAVFSLGGDRESRLLHAKRAWWVLDEGGKSIELQCEGGEIEVAGRRTPLFRGKFRRSITGIHPDSWKGVPAVELLAGSEVPAEESAQEPQDDSEG